MSEQTFSTVDLRSRAQDSKRDASRKHKWALGSVETRTRPGNPRPLRAEENMSTWARKRNRTALAELKAGGRAEHDRKTDVLDATSIATNADSSDSSSDFEEKPSPPADAGVMYSFDAPCGPSHGSQILNLALTKAEERFRDKETAKLVKSEYDVLNSDGDSVGLTPVKKSKGKARTAEATRNVETDEDEYEFV